MRAHAVESGFTLNEYTLRPIGSTGKIFCNIRWIVCIWSFIDLGIPGEPVEISSEEDIFDFIGYTYKTPEERSK